MPCFIIISMFKVMNLLIINLLFLGCYGFILPQNNTNDPDLQKLSFQVLISYGDSEPLCGGALVTDSVILTSASCIYSSFASQEDFLDNAELFGGGKVLVYLLGNITNVIVHPAFNQNDSTNDIALVKVWQPLPKRRILSMPLSSSWSYDKDLCTLTTWWNHTTSLWSNLSPRIVRMEKCFDKNRDDLVCAVTNSPNDSAIYEKDIGSPIVCDGKLAGIATASGHVTNITYYYSWIKETIRQLGPLNNTSEILDPSSVNVLDRLQSQKIITLLNELIEVTKNQNKSNTTMESYWNPRVVVPLNYVIFGMIIFLFASMLYHTLVNVALVHFSRR